MILDLEKHNSNLVKCVIEIYSDYMLINAVTVFNKDRNITIKNIHCEELYIHNKDRNNICRIRIEDHNNVNATINLDDIEEFTFKNGKLKKLYGRFSIANIYDSTVNYILIETQMYRMYLANCKVIRIMPYQWKYTNIQNMNLLHCNVRYFSIQYINRLRLVKTKIKSMSSFTPKLTTNDDLKQWIDSSLITDCRSDCIDKLGENIINYLISEII